MRVLYMGAHRGVAFKILFFQLHTEMYPYQKSLSGFFIASVLNIQYNFARNLVRLLIFASIARRFICFF